MSKHFCPAFIREWFETMRDVININYDCFGPPPKETLTKQQVVLEAQELIHLAQSAKNDISRMRHNEEQRRKLIEIEEEKRKKEEFEPQAKLYLKTLRALPDAIEHAVSNGDEYAKVMQFTHHTHDAGDLAQIISDPSKLTGVAGRVFLELEKSGFKPRLRANIHTCAEDCFYIYIPIGNAESHVG